MSSGIRGSANGDEYLTADAAGTNRGTRPPGVAFERHFTVPEVSAMWNLGVDVVRRLFENDPDVIKIGHDEILHKRRYITLKIPESVVRRVHRRITQVRAGKPS